MEYQENDDTGHEFLEYESSDANACGIVYSHYLQSFDAFSGGWKMA